MSSKEIVGFLSIIRPDKNHHLNSVQTDIQAGNLSFRSVIQSRTLFFWDNNSAGSDARIKTFPWKNTFLLDDNDLAVGHGYMFTSAGASYPVDPTGGEVSIGTIDYSRFRRTGTIGTVPAANIPRVFGSVMAHNGLVIGGWNQNTLISSTDVPIDYTQIGTVFAHPAHMAGGTVSTTAGSNFVTFVNAGFFDRSASRPGVFNLFRLETGADAGFYLIQHIDTSNNRLYLRTLNGTMFVAQATASGIPMTAAPGRRAFFNEVAIIPLSVGTVELGGRFNPRSVNPHLRDSFIVRLVFDKTGSTEAAAGTEQQGSYYMTLKPFTHGDGAEGSTTHDFGEETHTGFFTENALLHGFNFMQGGASALAMDWEGQRVWFGYTNASNQSGIAFWRYKTCETAREIANHLGTAGHASTVSPTVTLGAGDIIRGGGVGSNRWVYFSVYHPSGGNGGLIVFKPDLTTFQYNVGSSFPSAEASGIGVDKSRARTFSNLSTTAASNTIDDNVGTTFTAADIGRVIKINTGADAGNYKISSITDTNTVVVQTLAGGAVTFTGSSNVPGEIGDRVYLFFNNNTTGAGKINYMESMAPGTFLTRTVTMTNGANCTVHVKRGEPQKISVDPENGNVYWLSGDVQQQINKYDVTANSHSFRTIADIQSPAGGSPANPGTPTAFTAILVNSKFDEIWVGSDQGHIKLVKSNFTGAGFKRYFGTEVTTYVNPTGFLRSTGSHSASSNTNYVRAYYERGDGRVKSRLSGPGATTEDAVLYSRESDNWTFNYTQGISNTQDMLGEVHDPYGRAFRAWPQTSTGKMSLHQYEIQYQWNNATTSWIPLEVAQNGVPNKNVSDNSVPGCRTRPIHSTFENLFAGVKVRFNRQGGGTPANNEFLGRGGQTRTTASDGTTTSATNTFGGSGFLAGDAGRIIRIESGADIGVYRIATFVNATQITLVNTNGTAFSASATAGSITYTIWDFGTPGANAGPENVSFLLADGFGKDNTQDITGLTYECYDFKTRLHENNEPRKFAVENPLAVPGALSTGVYFENYIRASPQYDAATSNHRALPGAEHTLGRQVVDWNIDKTLGGTGAKSTMRTSPSSVSVWAGIQANNSVLGASLMVDLGANAEVGFIQVRAIAIANPSPMAYTGNQNGLIANIYKVDDGATPAASSTVRTSGTTNINASGANVTTLTLTSGDFLGAVTTGPNSNGAVSATQSVFVAPVATFVTGDRGKILKITAGAGADNGSYRITAVSGDGSTISIRNLDQTAKLWTVSASGITYEVRNGVQEEDMIAVPNLGAAVHRLAVERLLSETSLQVRTGPNATITNQSYQCIVPTWTHVKRLSFSTEALPPDVSNNGSWFGLDGREQNNNQDFKLYWDLTDLPQAQRTGRWWKLTMVPRFNGDVGNGEAFFSTMEFFSTTGARLAISRYSLTDESRTNADFLFNHINRFDFIQAADDASAGIAGFNGNANLGGTDGDTITATTGGNKFLGFRVRPKLTDGNLPSGTGVINSATAAFPASASVGRFIRILTGANANNIYRISVRNSASQVTVTTPSGGAVTWGGTESSIEFTIHEGINMGGTSPDKFVFLEDGREFTIKTINDALTQITIEESFQPPRTNKAWEIRRPGYDTASTATEAAKTARLTRPQSTYPVQSGDMTFSTRGSLIFFSEDLGTGYQRADGVIAGGNGIFTGTEFHPDDVGRLFYVVTGVNKGIYEIQTYTSATSVTVKNHYTGAAVSFTADAGPVTYQVWGDRRFRVSKLVVGLRA